MEINIAEKPFWALNIKDVLAKLETSQNGLTEKEAGKRAKQFGKNEIKGDGRVKKILIFFRQFKSPLIFILIIAGTVTLILQDWVDAGVIFLAIAVNASLGFYQENKAEESLTHLKTYLKERTRVLRNGQEYEIDVAELVPGDIVHLTMGSRVPADARIFSESDLHIDESILTGESLPVIKNTKALSPSTDLAERLNMAFGGTLVVEGSALAVITATGQNTEIGRIAKLVASTKGEATPLQRSVQRLAWFIAVILLIFIGGIFALGVLSGQSIFDMFLVAVAMAVGAIPEGLPIALTVILAVGVEQLAKRKGVVRKLLAAEALGSTTLILTDKTGTLTQAKMELSDIVTVDELIKIDGTTYDSSRSLTALTSEQKEILKITLPNVDVLIENPKAKPGKWRIVGRPLERNIVQAAARSAIVLTSFREKVKFLSVLPFNSTNKFSASFINASDVFSHQSVRDKNFIAILGAPDILLERAHMKKDDYVAARRGVDTLAAAGRRVLGVGVMALNGQNIVKDIKAKDIKNIEFIGVLSFYDPVRPEVVNAMHRVESFGARTIMVTGDHKGTALSVAHELGWDVDESNVLEGKDISEMEEKELIRRLEGIRIFARVSPADKVKIVNAYQKTGETVAMTGDGVNDAPSLKMADIGIAVGSGTDVAKDVADLVLLDDNFQTIVAAIEEGRRIISNIRKVTVYLLSDTLDEVMLIGGSLLVGLPLPLSALQILWVNFFSDSFPALAFAFEKNGDDVGLVSKKKKLSILAGEVKFLILIIGTATSALLFGIYWWLLNFTDFEEDTVRTFIFAAFGVYTLFVAFSLRSLKKSIFTFNPLSNLYLLAGVGFGTVLMAAAVYIPFLQKIFSTTALSAVWIAGIFGFIVVNILAIEVTKWAFIKLKIKS